MNLEIRNNENTESLFNLKGEKIEIKQNSKQNDIPIIQTESSKDNNPLQKIGKVTIEIFQNLQSNIEYNINFESFNVINKQESKDNSNKIILNDSKGIYKISILNLKNSSFSNTIKSPQNTSNLNLNNFKTDNFSKNITDNCFQPINSKLEINTMNPFKKQDDSLLKTIPSNQIMILDQEYLEPASISHESKII